MAATISDRFQSTVSFTDMLTRIGFTAAERTQFNIDGFTTMEILLLQFKGDVKGFMSYVENLNKTFVAASTANLRVYYNPLKLKRIIVVVHYFDQALFLIPSNPWYWIDQCSPCSPIWWHVWWLTQLWWQWSIRQWHWVATLECQNMDWLEQKVPFETLPAIFSIIVQYTLAPHLSKTMKRSLGYSNLPSLKCHLIMWLANIVMQRMVARPI